MYSHISRSYQHGHFIVHSCQNSALLPWILLHSLHNRPEMLSVSLRYSCRHIPVITSNGATSHVWHMTRVVFSGSVIFNTWPLVPEVLYKIGPAGLSTRFSCNFRTINSKLMNILFFGRTHGLLQFHFKPAPQRVRSQRYRGKYEFFSTFLATALGQSCRLKWSKKNRRWTSRARLAIRKKDI